MSEEYSTDQPPIPPALALPCWWTPKIPYKCPVCLGRGFVEKGFYSSTTGQWTTSSTIPEQCRSCGGAGIVFSQ